MKAPTIFTWPTPWLWGAIAFLVVINADGFSELVGRACVIVIVASAIHYFRERRRRPEENSGSHGGLSGRLDEIERRLTDTQDVMIALSEKMDRWELEGRPTGGEEPPDRVGSPPPVQGGPTL